jgi:addiction module HigA family antidote
LKPLTFQPFASIALVGDLKGFWSRMPMKNPPHPGRLIKDEIEGLGLSVAQAAKGLGVTRQQLYRVINGECGISAEMAVRLERGIGSSAATWLRMQMNYDLAQVQKRVDELQVKRLWSKEAV